MRREPPHSAVSRRQFIGRSAGLALAVGGVGSFVTACGGDDDSAATDGGGSGEVVVMSWVSYVTPFIAERFKKVTGITMRGVAAESDQDMFTKIKAGGGSQYDVVFANCGWAPTYAKNDLIEAMDPADVPASKDLYPPFREDTSFPYITDDGKLLLFPNQWSSLSLIWNKTADWIPTAPYSWKQLWSEEVPDGKVIMNGAPDDFISIAGLALGVPREEIYAMSGSQLEEAASYLAELKPFQINSAVDGYADALRTKKAWVGQASSLGIAYTINDLAGEDVAEAIVPEEGALGWIDGAQLVKGAKNRENALRFVDFFGRDPEIQRYLWKEYNYPQCSAVSTEKVLGAGGAEAERLKSLGGSDPDLSKQLLYQAPPDDPQAWAQAYDKVVA